MIIKPYKVINELSKKYPLKNEEKILLGTDGSITNILEILFNEEVVVKTTHQEVRNNTSYRSVILEIKGIPLIYATSKISLKIINNDYLRKNIKKDLLSANIPIGKILKIHNLETRREIKNIDYKEIDDTVKSYLKTDKKALPQRTYNIIYNSKVLMEITEIFNIGEYLEN